MAGPLSYPVTRCRAICSFYRPSACLSTAPVESGSPMFRFALHYFVLYALVATVWPYFPTFLKARGFSMADIGRAVEIMGRMMGTPMDTGRPMKPWLAKIACRLAQDEWRTRRKEAMRISSARNQFEEADSDPDPLQSLVADERARRLWRAVERISRAERTAVILYYREGLSVEDVAEATGVSAGTVKTLLFRARNHLRASLYDV
jgi:RNA polymerase sigma factor (sigma-70 family)